MKNLQSTALPSKAELQGLVADEKFTKKFAVDARKFSRNFEISTFYDKLNLGKFISFFTLSALGMFLT